MPRSILTLIGLALFAATAPAPAAVPVSEGYATTPDGVRLYYRVAGTGEDVVLAPFALYHGTSLDRLAKGRRIVTYDPRGSERSTSSVKESASAWRPSAVNT